MKARIMKRIMFFIAVNCIAPLLCIVSMKHFCFGDTPGPVRDNAAASTVSVIPLSLETSLGIAITKNFELKVIQSQGFIRKLAIRERWRDFFPSLSLSYMQTEESKQRDTDTRQHRLNVATDIVVYDGGQRSLSYDIARLEQILARNDYRIALNKLITEVSQEFFLLLRSREEIAIHQKTLKRSAMQLEFITREYELGEATKLDMLAISAQVKEVELNLEKAKNAFMTSKNKFRLLLRIDRRQPISIEGDIERDFAFSPPPEEIKTERLIASALKNRKEIESTDLEYLISRRKYLMSRHYYYPKFSVGLNYSLTDDSFFPRERGWGVNFKVTSALFGNTGSMSTGYSEDYNGNSRTYTNSGSVNVLDNMGYRRSIFENKISVNSAKDKKHTIRQQVAMEVETLYGDLQHTWEMIGISKHQRDLYDSFLEIERLKADMGESRRYDLVKKEIERGEAAVAYLDSLIRYCTAASTMETATGVDVGFLKLTRYKKKSAASSQ